MNLDELEAKLEDLKTRIKQYLPTNDSEYALPFAVLVSKNFNSFAAITKEKLRTDDYATIDYKKTHHITLEEKINEVVKILRNEYDSWNDFDDEKYFFEEINAFVSEILLSFYEEELDDESYHLSSVVIFDESLGEDVFLGEIGLWISKMYDDKHDFL